MVRIKKRVAALLMVMMLIGLLPMVKAFADDTDKATWENTASDVEVEPENPENGTIVFVVATMPEEALNRSVKAAVSYGPAYETLKAATMSGLNSYVDSVELEPGKYYCSYFVSNDPAMDYPVEARDNMYLIDVESGSCTVVYLDVSGVSFYESITGKHRYYDKEETVEIEEGFDTSTTGQIGCWVTVPKTFDLTVQAYVQNLFTGDMVTLDIYAANDYAAVASNVVAGRYKVVGTRVIAENKDRYTVKCEQETLTTKDIEGFHLTVIDNQNPETEMVTPSRDNNATVQEANKINEQKPEENTAEEVKPAPTPTSEPEIEKEVQEKHPNIISVLAVVILASFVVAGAIFTYLWVAHKEE